MIKMGQFVKDIITGFAGRVTGRCEYITGCNQLLVQPPLKADGDFAEARWIDEDRLEVDGDGHVLTLKRTAPGADIPAPIR